MALLHSIALFAGVATAAGAMTVAGLNFTADTVTKSITSVPRAKVHVRPNYVGYLPPRKAADFDIAKSIPVVPSGPATRQPALPTKAAATHTVDATSLWVRSGPDKSTQRQFSLKRGATVTVTGRQGNWFAVTTPDGRSGWAFGDYLKPAPAAATAAAAE